MDPEELKEGAEELQENVQGTAEILKDKAAELHQTFTDRVADLSTATDT